GVAYVMKSERHIDLPRRLQIEFSQVIQAHTDAEGGEVSSEQIWQMFEAEYLKVEGPLALNSVHTSAAAGERDALEVKLYANGEPHAWNGTGNGPIAAFIDAIGRIGYEVRVLDYAEHALGAGGDATAAAYVECQIGERTLWGVGLDANIVTASLKAVVSAIN